jgi:hypothetical protein
MKVVKTATKMHFLNLQLNDKEYELFLNMLRTTTFAHDSAKSGCYPITRDMIGFADFLLDELVREDIKNNEINTADRKNS